MQSFDLLELGFLEGGLEYWLVPEPGVYGGPVQTSVASCIGDGTSLSKGGYDLGLGRRQ